MDDNATGTVFRDVLFLTLLGFVALVVMMLPHLNPPEQNNTDEAPPPGNVIVEIRWPDEIDADVDLWVQAPGDHPVGYSNKGGTVFNLLRDDLGAFADLMKLNYETAVSRGIPDGEYTVNIHMFRNVSRIWPVPVVLQVTVKATPSASSKPLLETQGVLRREGEERTLLRFKLQNGSLVAGSVHNLHRSIRPVGKGRRP